MLPPDGQAAVRILGIPRIPDERVYANSRELAGEEHELAGGGHLLPIENDDGGRFTDTTPLEVGLKQGMHHRRRGREWQRHMGPTEGMHGGQGQKGTREGVVVGRARRRLRVVLRKLEGAAPVRKKRIQP